MNSLLHIADGALHRPFHYHPAPSTPLFRWANQRTVEPTSELREPSSQKVKFSAQRKRRAPLPNYKDASGRPYLFKDFISHPLGIESLLNKRSLQSYQALDSHTYRCILQTIKLLNFEVSPILVLRVVPGNDRCLVEMVSCKFEGSKAVERQNEYFSALMMNNIRWDLGGSEPYMVVDVKLNVTLEVPTKPFALFPVSAVESPGNLVIQSLLDRLVPLLIEQLHEDYAKWVLEQLKASS